MYEMVSLRSKEKDTDLNNCWKWGASVKLKAKETVDKYYTLTKLFPTRLLVNNSDTMIHVHWKSNKEIKWMVDSGNQISYYVSESL